MSLADRKKNRATRKQSLKKQMQEQSSKTSYDDPRQWMCARNKDGIGSAVIRFLMPCDDDVEYYVNTQNLEEGDTATPFYIMHHQHGFKGSNGKWFINNCPTSVIESDCPVCEANGEIVDEFGGWDAVDDNHPGKKLVRNRKRKEVFYANVLIIEDAANPENVGQVKIFKYGRAIQNQVEAQLMPQFEDEKSCDVSDYWDGRNFRLKIVKKDGYTNYDKSSWDDVSAVADTDDEIEAILNKQFTLCDFVADDKYKSYDTLVKEFKFTQGNAKARSKRSMDQEDGGTPDTDTGSTDTEDEQAPKRSRNRNRTSEDESDKADKPAVEESKPTTDDDDDDYFASLLDD